MSSRSLWFVIPAFGRFELTGVCLRQLRRTCDALVAAGVFASAVVAGDDGNLVTAAALGFEVVEQANMPLGRKWNDAFARAAGLGADYVVPFGTDNAVDWRVLAEGLPAAGEVSAFRRSSIVSPDGSRIVELRISYEGGSGVRVFPTGLLEPLRFRPVAESRTRACDGSARKRLQVAWGRRLRWVYRDQHPLQILNFKSAVQLNPFGGVASAYGVAERPFALDVVAGMFPAVFVDELDAYYAAAQAGLVAA